MAIREKDVKRYSAIALVVFLVVVSFLTIKPILLSVFAGLILSYIFYPVYKRVYHLFGERTTSALGVSILIVIVVFIPFWFFVPLVLKQLFDAFTFLQALDVGGFVRTVFPSLPIQIQVDLTTTFISLIGKITTSSLNSLTGFLLDLPSVLLHFTVIIFVFFFSMRDADKLKSYVSELSPLKKEKGILLANQFKQITSSLIYGNFIIGIIQGILTGIGLLVFGVPNALLLTLIAIIASILPVIGPWAVWIPAAIYLFSSGNAPLAIGFAVYSILVVSTIDNILRPYFVARKTKSASVIVLVGMIGGLISFGLLGLLIGPLILEYVVLFLEAYKNRALADMFESE